MNDDEVYAAAFLVGYEAELMDLPYDPFATLDSTVEAGYNDGRLSAIVDMLFDVFDEEI